MGNKKYVIIGGVACGPKTAARIRRLEPEAEITLLEKGELLSYAGCGLPFYLSGEVHDHNELMSTPAGVVRDTQFFKAVKDIKILNHTIAEKIDKKNKIVHAHNLQNNEAIELSYDKLVLAVGGDPAIPPIEGRKLNNVNSLTTVEDARKIRDQSGKLAGKKAVIIGAGLIGIEVCESFHKQGMDVTMIEMLDYVLPILIDREIAFHVHGEMKKNGIKLLFNEKVKQINGDDRGNVVSVSTDKSEMPADLVLIAIGTRPNTKLAIDAGLEIGQTGAIKIDGNCRTSDPDIYAGGDCAENISLVTGRPVYAPLGSTANKHGRIIADNICGKKSNFPGVLGTAICRIFNMNIARTGINEKEAKQLGYDYITVLSPSTDKAHFHPEAKLIVIKLIADRKTRKLLGAQIVGPGDVAKRLEIIITAMTHGATVDEICNYDLAYAPPFSPAMDNIIIAANIAQNKIDGLAKSLAPAEVKEKIDKGDDFILLDVRSPKEFEQMKIDDKRVSLIPLGKLRERHGELDKNKEIVTFCKISLRGYEAQLILDAAGFKNVKFMDGGLVGWPYEKVVNA